MASFVAHPIADALETRPAPERLNLRDGALLTEKHFQTEQLYHRGQVSRLALHLHGAGTVAGLNVTYDPTTGDDVEVKVAPGMALDRLGRIVELQQHGALAMEQPRKRNAQKRLHVKARTRRVVDARLESSLPVRRQFLGFGFVEFDVMDRSGDAFLLRILWMLVGQIVSAHEQRGHFDGTLLAHAVHDDVVLGLEVLHLLFERFQFALLDLHLLPDKLHTDIPGLL